MAKLAGGVVVVDGSAASARDRAWGLGGEEGDQRGRERDPNSELAMSV